MTTADPYEQMRLFPSDAPTDALAARLATAPGLVRIGASRSG